MSCRADKLGYDAKHTQTQTQTQTQTTLTPTLTQASGKIIQTVIKTSGHVFYDLMTYSKVVSLWPNIWRHVYENSFLLNVCHFVRAWLQYVWLWLELLYHMHMRFDWTYLFRNQGIIHATCIYSEHDLKAGHNTTNIPYLFESLPHRGPVNQYDAIDRSTFAQVMACFLIAPSHYINQCWLLISEVLWHSPENNFTLSAQATILYKWVWKLLWTSAMSLDWDKTYDEQAEMAILIIVIIIIVIIINNITSVMIIVIIIFLTYLVE